jgi:hypothetical protein
MIQKSRTGQQFTKGSLLHTQSTDSSSKLQSCRQKSVPRPTTSAVHKLWSRDPIWAATARFCLESMGQEQMARSYKRYVQSVQVTGYMLNVGKEDLADGHGIGTANVWAAGPSYGTYWPFRGGLLCQIRSEWELHSFGINGQINQ